MMPQRTLSVVGLGYIGLPTAAVLADHGWAVIGVDVNRATVDTINAGGIHIVEPDLDAVVARAIESGCLRAVSTPEPADVFMIAVPTPFKDHNKPDLSFIEAVAKTVAPVLRRGNVIILESTSPVGATERMMEWMAAIRPDLSFPSVGQSDEMHDVHVAHCPERVLPGNVMHELVANDRVIGGVTRSCADAAAKVYRTFVKGECVLTDVRTAELCKLAENSFRDVNIAFANELSLICDRLNINVWDLVALANRHPRVNILRPGPGVGGHCIAVDPWFIVDSAPDEAQLIAMARRVNDSKPAWVLRKIDEAIEQAATTLGFAGSRDVTIACFGLSFKPDIDDLRESPSLQIAEAVAARHLGTVLAVEPYVNALPASAHQMKLVGISEALERAHVVVLLVDHQAFHEIQPLQMANKEVVDTRGLWRRP
jgi:UDP-N-acetyl-D-mannosaminuronic acid dehydrogenase